MPLTQDHSLEQGRGSSKRHYPPVKVGDHADCTSQTVSQRAQKLNDITTSPRISICCPPKISSPHTSSCVLLNARSP